MCFDLLAFRHHPHPRLSDEFIAHPAIVVWGPPQPKTSRLTHIFPKDSFFFRSRHCLKIILTLIPSSIRSMILSTLRSSGNRHGEIAPSLLDGVLASNLPSFLLDHSDIFLALFNSDGVCVAPLPAIMRGNRGGESLPFFFIAFMPVPKLWVFAPAPDAYVRTSPADSLFPATGHLVTLHPGLRAP